jgi:hypothetical protein
MEISAAEWCGVLPIYNAVKIQGIGWIPNPCLGVQFVITVPLSAVIHWR